MRRLLFALLLCLPGVAHASPQSGAYNTVVGCVYDPFVPTLTGAGFLAIQCDSAGHPIVALTTANSLLATFDADIPFIPVIQIAAYSGGNSLGGLQTVSVFRNVQNPAGKINQVMVSNTNGATPAITVYAFDQKPTTTTCTDKAAFVMTAADLPKLVPGFPVIVQPATALGFTMTTGSIPINVSVKNQDSAATTNLYFCVLSGGSVTPAGINDYIIKVSVEQD